MQEPAHTIAMDEASARRVVLARAIETSDTQGRLASAVERGQIDRQALEAARAVGEPTSAAASAQFLKIRAGLLLQAVGPRDPALAALQDKGAGERWISAGVPLAALLLGVFTDQVANPHKVNLLSKPLLLLLLWNVIVYLLLLANLLRASPEMARQPRFTGLRQWLAGASDWRRRPGHVRSEATAAFLLRWHSLTAGLYGQRLTRVMHLSAAAWALGVALSLFFGGVWASYGVQWESTFLSASDVHRFLSVLFKPVTSLFPWASFSLDEVRSLRATGLMPAPPDAADNFTGRRWVFLYAALLGLVIVLPRLLLAALAWWQEQRLANQVRIALDDDYFQRVLMALSPARVQLCIYAHRAEDRAALLRVLVHRAEAPHSGVAPGPDEVHELVTGSGGESLRLLDLQDAADPASLARQQTRSGGWSGRLRATFFRAAPVELSPSDKALRLAKDQSDVVLHVVDDSSDLQVAAPLLAWLGKPVLLLVNAAGAAPGVNDLVTQCKAQMGPGNPVAAVLDFDQFARCWVQERVLLGVIAEHLPQYKTAGFARLAQAWDERNLTQLRESMSVIAGHLLAAARQIEDVGKAPRSLVSLVSPGEREAHEQRLREAMAAVVERLQRSEAQATSSLLQLHGIAPSSAGVLNHRLEEKFVVQNAISATQAGMAGAATGAAMGVSIDLLTAGLTLGLAAAAGAVVGGGAAWVAAVWKNNATPAGNSVVHLSDDMLRAMVEVALLRYLAVIHFDRGPLREGGIEVRPAWRSAVVATVQRRSLDLGEQWLAARSRQDAMEPKAALVAMLESIALDVLAQLYPEPPH